jgi:hypothetical protein
MNIEKKKRIQRDISWRRGKHRKKSTMKDIHSIVIIRRATR